MIFNLKRKKARRGFTLVEILVVVTIIGALAAVGLVSYQSANKKSRDSKRKADMEQIRAALEMYRADDDKGWYPRNLNLLVPDYMTALPVPPANSRPTRYNNGYNCPYPPSGSRQKYRLRQLLETTGTHHFMYNP